MDDVTKTGLFNKAEAGLGNTRFYPNSDTDPQKTWAQVYPMPLRDDYHRSAGWNHQIPDDTWNMFFHQRLPSWQLTFNCLFQICLCQTSGWEIQFWELTHLHPCRFL